MVVMKKMNKLIPEFILVTVLSHSLFYS